ncbi:MAG: penicillin-binding protein 1C [Hyphomonadaceae bacterium]|nr:penicillin-binding protein 1C [Hyphomonadaceae bacterium]
MQRLAASSAACLRIAGGQARLWGGAALTGWRGLPRRLRQGLVTLAALAITVIALDRAFPPPLERGENLSQWVSDREGRPLRAFPTAEGRWRLPAELDEIDPVFLDALLEVEDKRFRRHGGVDWIAMVRALVSSARAGHVVSGGSTITMQTARLLEPRPRTVGSKLIEMVRAHQIEARLSKDEILELYLTLAPYGGNLEGVRAASWSYFGHGPDRLSDDEITLLIALPQSPEQRRPDRREAGALAGREEIAGKLERLGFLSPQRAEEARTAALPSSRHAFPNMAWHASAEARRDANPAGDVRTTLYRPLQAELEAMLATRAAMLDEDVQISAIIVDIPTRAVRAAIGSADRGRPGGWIDLTDQPRSPGSTLKPFIYAVAFDDGIAAPGTVISDLPKRFDAYQPENFDRSFRGDVTVAEALQHSLNVPAVLALAEVGPHRFAAQLAMAGAPPRLPPSADQEAGLALALGGAGMTVQDLALLYAALGDGGVARPLVWLEDEVEVAKARPGQRLLGEASARSILEILARAPTPSGRIPGRLTEGAPEVAFKTGTSYGFRDAWAAGVAGDLAIIVWVGRADGAPRPGETGRKAALPILFEIADRAAHHLPGQGEASRRILAEALPPARAAQRNFDESGPPEILFPPADAELWAGQLDGRPARDFVMSGRGEGHLRWYIDGQPARTDAAGLAVWSPHRSGFYTVSAVDEAGRTSRVQVRVIGAAPG